MAFKRRVQKTRKPRKKIKRAGDRSRCRFCRAKVEQIDFKDVPTLQKLVTSQAKIFSRKRSGNCNKHQRSAKIAIKRARYMALMPYVGS